MQRPTMVYRRTIPKPVFKEFTSIRIKKSTRYEFTKLKPQGMDTDGFLRLLLQEWTNFNSKLAISTDYKEITT